MKAPRVSVIVTTSGRWELLEHALQSVLAQDYQDFEILVVNDGEFDLKKRFPQNVSSVIDGDARIRWFNCTREGTKRVAVLCNLGLDHARGVFATYLCDDDYWLPGRLSRMMAAVDKGADWVVDKCRWIMPDGLLVEQEHVGQYQYKTPLEEGHHDLALHMVDGLGSNFIVHDCALHKVTADRWPTDAEHHTPVDWRFWCKLYSKIGKPVVQNEVGAIALVPGAWRNGMTTEQAMAARRIAGLIGGNEMASRGKQHKEERRAQENVGSEKLVGFAKNVSGKLKKFTRPGGPIKVPPEGTIEVSKITRPDADGNVRLPDGFALLHEDLVVPALGDENVDVPDRVRSVDDVIGLKERGREADEHNEQAVRGMSYNDLRAYAKAIGVVRLNRPKAAIQNDVLAKIKEGARPEGGCFDDQTITSADIASPENPNQED